MAERARNLSAHIDIDRLRARRDAHASDLQNTLKRASELSGREQYLTASILLAHAQTLLGKLQELSDAISEAKAGSLLPKGGASAALLSRTVL